MKTSIWLIAIAALFMSFAAAQTAVPTYKPNQTITISVTFEGIDVSKITAVRWIANISTPALPSQPKFSTQMNAGASKPGSTPNTFDVSFTVQTNQASGDYDLNDIRATVANPSVDLMYAPPEFPQRMLRIDNSQTLTKPTIKDVKVLP
jgi:hypothetical protein